MLIKRKIFEMDVVYMEIVKEIAALVGCILSCISLLTLMITPLRKKVGGWVAHFADKTETTNALGDIKRELSEIRIQMTQDTQEYKQQIDDLKKQVNAIIQFNQKNHEALKDMIRERIVSAYYLNLENKTLHFEEWETISELSSSYEDLGGNSFVKGLVRQMSMWTIIQ